MNQLQIILTRIAEYAANKIANRVLARFRRRNSFPQVSHYPPVVVACAQNGRRSYISETKHIKREHLHEILLGELETRLGHIGEISHYANNSRIGYCAEPNAANELLRHEQLTSLDDIYFGKAYRPRTGVVILPCGNCRTIFRNVVK